MIQLLEILSESNPVCHHLCLAAFALVLLHVGLFEIFSFLDAFENGFEDFKKVPLCLKRLFLSSSMRDCQVGAPV